MRAMLFETPGRQLRLDNLPTPKPGAGQFLIRVHACAVCRTDLHVIDGELTRPKLPLIPGHEIVVTIEARGVGAERFEIGDRVGIPWLGWSCGECAYCKSGRENLCDRARFTGYTIDGGYAEYTVADQCFCFLIPSLYGDAQAAPLLCAGLIGYRSLVKAGNGKRLGIYGFTRPGDRAAEKFALALGAIWAGGSNELPPEKLDAAIIFAPVGELVPQALRAVGKGGVVVCGGIHMSDIPSFPYEIL